MDKIFNGMVEDAQRGFENGHSKEEITLAICKKLISMAKKEIANGTETIETTMTGLAYTVAYAVVRAAETKPEAASTTATE